MNALSFSLQKRYNTASRRDIYKYAPIPPHLTFLRFDDIAISRLLSFKNVYSMQQHHKQFLRCAPKKCIRIYNA
jgi:hypothetical protein